MCALNMSAENGLFARQNLENRRSIKIIINNFMIIDKALRVVVQIALSEHLETQLFRGPIYLSIVYAQSLASASATTTKLVISLNI